MTDKERRLQTEIMLRILEAHAAHKHDSTRGIGRDAALLLLTYLTSLPEADFIRSLNTV